MSIYREITEAGVRGVRRYGSGIARNELGQFTKGTQNSTGKNCKFRKANDGKWYFGIEDRFENYEWYGPFATYEAAVSALDRNFANPGGWGEDTSGTRPPPPNARRLNSISVKNAGSYKGVSYEIKTKGQSPYTIYYATIDGQRVSEYCDSATEAGQQARSYIDKKSGKVKNSSGGYFEVNGKKFYWENNPNDGKIHLYDDSDGEHIGVAPSVAEAIRFVKANWEKLKNAVNWLEPHVNEEKIYYEGWYITVAKRKRDSKWSWEVAGEDNTGCQSKADAIRQAKEMVDRINKA